MEMGRQKKDLVLTRPQFRTPKQIIYFKIRKQTKMKSLCCCQTHKTGMWVKLGNIFFSLDSTWGVFWAGHPKVREKELVFVWFPRNGTSTCLIVRTDSLMLLREGDLEGLVLRHFGVGATVVLREVCEHFYCDFAPTGEPVCGVQSCP